MEQQNSNTNSPVLCRAGCGFYGSSSMDGMCSKCYKDSLQRKMQPPPSSSTSAPIQIGSSSSRDLGLSSLSLPSTGVPHLAKPASTASLSSTFSDDSNVNLSASPSTSSLPQSLDSPSSLASSEKKINRCSQCNKKVGLTGFECRCGGLFCPVHRYSDVHKCSFDYKQLGLEEIRKNNPAVRGEKVQKL